MSPEFTGKKRFRVLRRLFRPDLLVLQVEVEGFVPEYNGGGPVGGSYRTWWIDARPEWMLELDSGPCNADGGALSHVTANYSTACNI